MYIYAYPSADTISSISAVDAVIAHVVMAVRFSVVAPGFLYTDENWVEFFVSVESSSFLLNKLRAFRERKLNRILLGLSADVIMGTIKLTSL